MSRLPRLQVASGRPVESAPDAVQLTARPSTRRASAVRAAAAQRLRRLGVPQACWLSGASMPARRTVVPPTRMRSPATASARPCRDAAADLPLPRSASGIWLPVAIQASTTATAATPTPVRAVCGDTPNRASASEGMRKPTKFDRNGREAREQHGAKRQHRHGLAVEAGAAGPADAGAEGDRTSERDRTADVGPCKPRRKRLCGDGQPLRSSQRRRPRPCGSDQQSSTRRSETRQRRSQGRRAGRPRPLRQRRPGRARALRQGDAGRLRLLRRRAPRILHALAPDLPPQPHAGADILMPLEAVGLLRPAEHGPPFAKAEVETGMPLPLRPTLRPNRGAHWTGKCGGDQSLRGSP